MVESRQFSLHECFPETRAIVLLDRILVTLLAGLILYSPLPFGSVQYSSILILELIALACFLLWMIKLVFLADPQQLIRFRELHNERKQQYKALPFFVRYHHLARFLKRPALRKWYLNRRVPEIVVESEEQYNATFSFFLFFGYPVRNTGLEVPALVFLFVALLQIVPMPVFVVALVSPSTAALYASAAQAAGAGIPFHPLSLDPFATLSRLLQYGAYFLIYLVVVNAVRARSHYPVLLITLFGSAVFQGVYGMYEFLSGSQHIFNYAKKHNLESVTGTFINRNHYAAYLELSLPLMLALIAGRIALLRSIPGNVVSRIARAFESEGSKTLLLLFLIVVVAVGLVFSLSRSGISFAILSVTAFFFLHRQMRNGLTRKGYWIAALAGLVAFSVWIGLEPLLLRFLKISDEFISEGTRMQVWKDTFRIFLDFPLFGTGAGTFPQIFPMYRSFVLHAVYYQAHNDYLQILSENGLIALFLIFAFYDVCLRRIRKLTASPLTRFVLIQIGAFCSLLTLALHSVTDFSFQIPAIAATGAMIFGLMLGQNHAEEKLN